jgi:hypothetical protein
MPIRLVATGRVTEEPSPLEGEDERTVVFVLDPYPGPGEAGLAHACEVVCRTQELAKRVSERVQRGEPVTVSGTLMMMRMHGPLEDDLCGVRVKIVANTVRPGVA